VRRASGQPDSAFVARLYRELLGRPPEAEAVFVATGKLALGFLRRDLLRGEIVSSAEYRARKIVRDAFDWLRDAPTPTTLRSLAPRHPDEVWLELTTRCNVAPACVMCGYARPGSRVPGREMNPQTWRALLPLLSDASRIGLHGAGEPLLYRHLFELLAALRETGANIGFNSNGHLLDVGVARRLVESGLGWISISLDAATAGTYLRIRRRKDFEPLLSKIRMLREVRDDLRRPRPEIEINMTLMRLNLEEAPAFVELAAGLRLDRVMFQQMQPGGAQRVLAPDGFVFDYREQELAGDRRHDETMQRARERARSLGVRFSYEMIYGAAAPRGPEDAAGAKTPGTGIPPSPAACLEPFRRLLFDVDGEAFVCCVQMVNRVLLGRAPDDSREEIWNGRRIRLVREAMFSGPAPFCCHGCFVTSGRGKVTRPAAISIT
jgi:MoaA/NifB/PqqE/SkfB family radical SAM enzyme